jgi:NRAMP (natural resistance-associated macrophage protein)-like metal ion transporter
MNQDMTAPAPADDRPHRPRKGAVGRFWDALGPGVITGAADDDPSGIATYSIAGAQFGLGFLWTSLLTWPLMAAVQIMCARIGMVTGRGLVASLRKKVPRRLLIAACIALFVANTLNVGADLSGMADAAEMLTGVGSRFFVVIFGAVIAWATIRMRYAVLANILKWLALLLFAYVASALAVGPAWGKTLHATIVPSLPKGSAGWSTLVAILGTTISPYLFFWQASQEVEEEKAMGRRTMFSRRGATPQELRRRRMDVGVGTFFSNVAMFFIILTTALTLHLHGVTQPETSRQVAEALTPIAGHAAALLYTAGLLGLGALAIPTLAGSGAYALAETFAWRQGIDEKFRRARAFYIAIAASIGVGITLDFTSINPIRALYWSAVINGLLAPFLLIGILMVASDSVLMQKQPSSRLARFTVIATAVVMFGAAIGMFVF